MNNGGMPIQAYELIWNRGVNGADVSEKMFTGIESSIVVPNLQPNTRYKFAVRALN